MNTDDFEQQLQQQPLQLPPAAWRREILAAARAELRPAPPPGSAELLTGWRELWARFPLAWGAVAGLWLGILGINAFLANSSGIVAVNTPAPAPRDWFMTWNLRNEQLQQLTAELGDFPERSPAPPAIPPGPRSDRRHYDCLSLLDAGRSAGVPAGFACEPSTGTAEKFEAPALTLSPEAAGTAALVRLRAHMDSGVKVPDLADTEGPVTESNCAGATPPGGEQLEVNEQSVTRLDTQRQVNSIRSAVLASLRAKGRSLNKIARPAQREWNASGREPLMVGDGMFGSLCDVNQGTTAGGERAGRGQSPRSSREAGNDRGAKGDRDMVFDEVDCPSHEGLSSAARLCARLRRKTGLGEQWRTNSGPPVKQVSGAQACAAGATLPKALSRVPEPVHQDHELESRMRENRLSGLGGGRRPKAVLYPHQAANFT